MGEEVGEYRAKGAKSATTVDVSQGSGVAFDSQYTSTYDGLAENGAAQNINNGYVNQRLNANQGRTSVETMDLNELLENSTSEEYVVMPGDTLETIAAKYNTTAQTIASENGITDINQIYAGQKLVISTANSQAGVSNRVNDPSKAAGVDKTTGTEVMQDARTGLDGAGVVRGANTSDTTNTRQGDNLRTDLDDAGKVNVNTTQSENLMEGNNAGIKQVGNVMLSAGYSGQIHSKSIASPEAQQGNGNLTSGNQQYQIGPSTDISAGTMSTTDYMYLVGQVAGEAGLNTDDMMGVCSTILNRVEAGGGFGSNVQSALSIGYWPFGKTCDKYLNYDASGNPSGFKSAEQLGDAEYSKLLEVQKVVEDAMKGIRNLTPTTFYYGGDGTNNYFSDRL